MTSTHRGRRARTLCVAFVVALFALPAAVLAHAELDTVSPADGTAVTKVLTEIAMTFTEDLDPEKSSIVLAKAGGAQVQSGGVVSPDDLKRMTLAITDLAAGSYEIRWTSASAEDGDIARGTTHFTYAPPGPTENDFLTPSPSAPSPSPSTSPSASPSVVPSPSPSAAGTPAASTSDVLIPIVVAIVVVGLLGAWLLRGRSRGSGPA